LTADLTRPAPPPYPFPGWSAGAGAGGADTPAGYVWQWMQADPRWQVGGDGRACRFTVGPGRATCKRPAVATLNRSSDANRPRRWAYCEQHLFGRHLHDGAVWQGRLVKVADGSQGQS
jgi:hypothetical protein